MFPQTYFRIKRGKKMTITMDTVELFFKGDSTLLVQYDTSTNLMIKF